MFVVRRASPDSRSRIHGRYRSACSAGRRVARASSAGAGWYGVQRGMRPALNWGAIWRVPDAGRHFPGAGSFADHVRRPETLTREFTRSRFIRGAACFTASGGGTLPCVNPLAKAAGFLPTSLFSLINGDFSIAWPGFLRLGSSVQNSGSRRIQHSHPPPFLNLSLPVHIISTRRTRVLTIRWLANRSVRFA